MNVPQQPPPAGNNPDYVRVSFEQGETIDSLRLMLQIERHEVESLLRRACIAQSAEMVKLRSVRARLWSADTSPEAASDPFFPNTTPNPTCSCRACNPKAWWMVLCATCGNKRCPHATNHECACTGSNEPGQEGSVFGDSPEAAADAIYEQTGRDLA